MFYSKEEENPQFKVSLTSLITEVTRRQGHFVQNWMWKLLQYFHSWYLMTPELFMAQCEEFIGMICMLTCVCVALNACAACRD